MGSNGLTLERRNGAAEVGERIECSWLTTDERGGGVPSDTGLADITNTQGQERGGTYQNEGR